MKRGENLKNGPGKGRPKGALNKATRDVKEFAERFIDDPEYRESLRRRVTRGQAPHMETLIWHYRFGKPKDTLEVFRPRPLVVELLTRDDDRPA